MVQRATITRALVAASVLLVVLGANPGAAAAEQHGFAVFEWYRVSQVNAKVSDQALGSLRTDGFKTVYADVGEYLEVADQPASKAQKTRLAQLKSDLRRFVARASTLGDAVHAVAGDLGRRPVCYRPTMTRPRSARMRRRAVAVVLVAVAIGLVVLEPFPKGATLLALTDDHGVDIGDLPAVVLLVVAAWLAT